MKTLCACSEAKLQNAMWWPPRRTSSSWWNKACGNPFPEYSNLPGPPHLVSSSVESVADSSSSLYTCELHAHYMRITHTLHATHMRLTCDSHVTHTHLFCRLNGKGRRHWVGLLRWASNAPSMRCSSAHAAIVSKAVKNCCPTSLKIVFNSGSVYARWPLVAIRSTCREATATWAAVRTDTWITSASGPRTWAQTNIARTLLSAVKCVIFISEGRRGCVTPVRGSRNWWQLFARLLTSSGCVTHAVNSSMQ